MDVCRYSALLFLLVLPLGLPAAQSLSDYQLGSGDQIQVQVFGEEDLSMEVRLSDAGTISYPFLGEIRVAGNTVSQLEAQIVKGLKGDYLVDPSVNVSVVEYRPFYINGEVKTPGGYPYQRFDFAKGGGARGGLYGARVKNQDQSSVRTGFRR